MTAAVRRMTPEDRMFVISTWSSSYRTSHQAGLISMASWADIMHRQIVRIISHPAVTTLVAYEPGVTDHKGRAFLYGFLTCATQQTVPYVYYVYVKSPYREGKRRFQLTKGHAELLFEAAGIDPRAPFAYACHTPTVSDLARKIPLAELNPLPARYLESP